MGYRSLWIFIFLILHSHAFFIEENSQSQTTSKPLIWPAPTKVNYTAGAQPYPVDPCSINYKVEAVPNDYIKEIINLYLINVFSCSKINPGSITLTIAVKDPNQMVATKKQQEAYQLNIRKTNKWELIAYYYVGFLRGFQTFSQLFSKQSSGQYAISGYPLFIDDSPNFLWRGLMIDTARHFLSTDTIKHTIDGLLYNKMNILHWHIVDEDSFPLQVPARPELSDHGKIGGTYSPNQIKSIINYAKSRGVRVIPQIDTPAHTDSWGRSEDLKDIVVKCNHDYEGQFDPTLDLTYEVVKDVLSYTNETFPDGYIHFGGDEIEEECYDKKPSIMEWMLKNNISSYKDLEIYYRKKEKSVWRNISSSKKAIYWANEEINLPVEDDDVIQWWGVSANVDRLKGKKNQIILSNYDKTYLDIGFGNRYGHDYGIYENWRLIYSFNPHIDGVNVIGGQVCMWSQLNNDQTQDQKVWIRASVMGQRLWNSGIDISTNLLNIVQRLIAQKKRMKSRGFKVCPVTVGLCEKSPEICFGS